jgi:hypothetical protein
MDCANDGIQLRPAIERELKTKDLRVAIGFLMLHLMG